MKMGRETGGEEIRVVRYEVVKVQRFDGYSIAIHLLFVRANEGRGFSLGDGFTYVGPQQCEGKKGAIIRFKNIASPGRAGTGRGGWGIELN